MQSYQKQLELALSHGILAEKTLETLLEEVLNTLLKLERSEFLQEQLCSNKANGHFLRFFVPPCREILVLGSVDI